MSDLLESGQAALVVVAVDHQGPDIEALLQNATETIVTETDGGDVEQAYEEALAAGTAAVLITTRADAAESAERRHRRWTSSVSVLPVTMHTTLVASTSSAPPPPSLVSSPREHPR